MRKLLLIAMALLMAACSTANNQLVPTLKPIADGIGLAHQPPASVSTVEPDDFSTNCTVIFTAVSHGHRYTGNVSVSLGGTALSAQHRHPKTTSTFVSVTPSSVVLTPAHPWAAVRLTSSSPIVKASFGCSATKSIWASWKCDITFRCAAPQHIIFGRSDYIGYCSNYHYAATPGSADPSAQASLAVFYNSSIPFPKAVPPPTPLHQNARFSPAFLSLERSSPRAVTQVTVPRGTSLVYAPPPPIYGVGVVQPFGTQCESAPFSGLPAQISKSKTLTLKLTR